MSAPKPPGQRQRRNRVYGAATLEARPFVQRVDLDGTHCPQVMAWWDSIWSSPSRAEWDESDLTGLEALAVLMDLFWAPGRRGKGTRIVREILAMSRQYGLTARSRLVLQLQTRRLSETPSNDTGGTCA